MPKLSTHDKLSKLSRIPFTKEGFTRLQKKYKKLQENRPAAVRELARARELGDLSENGLYTAAKSRLISLDNQIFKIEMTMKFADVIEIHNSNTVQIGSKVTVLDEGVEVEYQIVGDTETNPKEYKISQHAPIGRALMGKSPGDFAQIHTPSGKKTIEIKSVN